MLEKINGRKMIRGNELKENSKLKIIIDDQGITPKEFIVDIKPVLTEDKLSYSAKVKDGCLLIDFYNFDIEKYRGIEWEVIQYIED